MTPRGIRNNNPLNIRRGRTKWQGEETLTNPPKEEGPGKAYDPLFCQFDTMRNGWRAAFLLLKKYINVYQLDSVAKIIGRWAPANENNTRRYTETVCRLTKSGPGEAVTFGNQAQMVQIAAAMCCVENGMQFSPLRKPETLRIMYSGYKDALDSPQFAGK